MEKTEFTPIETFDDLTSKSDVRRDILNPLILQHNQVSNKTTSLDQRITVIESSNELDLIKTQLADAISRIVALENGSGEKPPVDDKSPKFYVLPLGGQSNMVGYGEAPHAGNFLDDISPRIKQLGRGNSWDSFSLNSSNTSYGSRFNELRTVDDQGLIPATPCLDHAQNMFQHNAGDIGGTVGAGLYIAKLLLPHIPSDYGILIVPNAYGGKGFHDGNHFQTNIQDTINRIKVAMDLNPSNKLLPFVWTQGENDGSHGSESDHYSKFKKYYADIKSGLSSFSERTVCGYKWFCCSPTKWAFGANTETSYTSFSDINSSRLAQQAGVYDNYKYLSSELPDEVFTVRIDIEDDGSFTETNREVGNGSTSGDREIHFSSEAYRTSIPRKVSNAIIKYGMGKEIPTVSQKIRGGLGVVVTDYVTNVYNNAAPLLGSIVSDASTLTSFAVKFNFALDPGLRADRSALVASGSDLIIRYDDGVVTFSVGGKALFVSAFYQGAWEGSWDSEQEFTFVYNGSNKTAMLYVNDKLVDSATGLISVSLPSSVTIGTPPTVRASVSNLGVYSLR